MFCIFDPSGNVPKTFWIFPWCRCQNLTPVNIDGSPTASWPYWCKFEHYDPQLIGPYKNSSSCATVLPNKVSITLKVKRNNQSHCRIPACPTVPQRRSICWEGQLYQQPSSHLPAVTCRLWCQDLLQNRLWHLCRLCWETRTMRVLHFSCNHHWSQLKAALWMLPVLYGWVFFFHFIWRVCSSTRKSHWLLKMGCPLYLQFHLLWFWERSSPAKMRYTNQPIVPIIDHVVPLFVELPFFWHHKISSIHLDGSFSISRTFPRLNYDWNGYHLCRECCFYCNRFFNRR